MEPQWIVKSIKINSHLIFMSFHNLVNYKHCMTGKVSAMVF